MTAVEVFSFGDAEFRAFLVDGEPWFVSGDALGILDLNRSSLTSLEDDEKGVHTMDTLGGAQSVGVINEPGLYSLILRSRKPEAKAFKRLLTHDVLPSIRKTGAYSLAPIETPEQLLARALTVANGVLEQKNATIAVLEPKAEAYDRVIATGNAQKIEYAARRANVGRTTAFQLLRAAGVLQKFNRSPKQQYAHRFIEEPKPFLNTRTGMEEIGWVTKVRPEHLDWLVTKLIDLKSEGLPNV